MKYLKARGIQQKRTNIWKNRRFKWMVLEWALMMVTP